MFNVNCMQDILDIKLYSDYQFFLSNMLHDQKYDNMERYSFVLDYVPLKKEEYSKLEWFRLVNLAAVLDYLYLGVEHMHYWFKSDYYCLDKPWFSMWNGESRVHLVFTSLWCFQKHNIFYDKNDLEIR